MLATAHWYMFRVLPSCSLPHDSRHILAFTSKQSSDKRIPQTMCDCFPSREVEVREARYHGEPRRNRMSFVRENHRSMEEMAYGPRTSITTIRREPRRSRYANDDSDRDDRSIDAQYRSPKQASAWDHPDFHPLPPPVHQPPPMYLPDHRRSGYMEPLELEPPPPPDDDIQVIGEPEEERRPRRPSRAYRGSAGGSVRSGGNVRRLSRRPSRRGSRARSPSTSDEESDDDSWVTGYRGSGMSEDSWDDTSRRVKQPSRRRNSRYRN